MEILLIFGSLWMAMGIVVLMYWLYYTRKSHYVKHTTDQIMTIFLWPIPLLILLFSPIWRVGSKIKNLEYKTIYKIINSVTIGGCCGLLNMFGYLLYTCVGTKHYDEMIAYMAGLIGLPSLWMVLMSQLSLYYVRKQLREA